jgi:hypothetical protein
MAPACGFGLPSPKTHPFRSIHRIAQHAGPSCERQSIGLSSTLFPLSRKPIEIRPLPFPETPDAADRQIRSGRRSYPLIRAVLAQLTAAVVVFGGYRFLESRFGPLAPLSLILALQSLTAAVVGQIMGLPKWWIPVNLLVPAAVAVALSLNLPSWSYPLAFLAFALVFWNSADDRVPLYLTNRTTSRALQDLLKAQTTPAGGQIRVADIGCGLGGTLLHLARHCPDMTFVGIESAPLPFAIARLRLVLSGLPNLAITYGDLWKQDLSEYQAVYCFLSPEPMTRLYSKARQEMMPGSQLISNSFGVPDIVPDEVVSIEDRRQTELLIYRF